MTDLSPLGDEEDPDVGLLAEGEGEAPRAESLDRRPIGGDEGARRDALSLMRRGREGAHLRTGVDEEPAFGGGVVNVEELADAGRRRRYWRPALAFPRLRRGAWGNAGSCPCAIVGVVGAGSS